MERKQPISLPVKWPQKSHTKCQLDEIDIILGTEKDVIKSVTSSNEDKLYPVPAVVFNC